MKSDFEQPITINKIGPLSFSQFLFVLNTQYDHGDAYLAQLRFLLFPHTGNIATATDEAGNPALAGSANE